VFGSAIDLSAAALPVDSNAQFCYMPRQSKARAIALGGASAGFGHWKQ
jgi:hypothetical protein